MVQVPAVSSEAVLPETVQTASVVEAKLTGKPEVAVAARARLVPAYSTPVMGKKVMVCAMNAGLTVKLCDTVGAGK
jgi:hypothetical protein